MSIHAYFIVYSIYIVTIVNIIFIADSYESL